MCQKQNTLPGIQIWQSDACQNLTLDPWPFFLTNLDNVAMYSDGHMGELLRVMLRCVGCVRFFFSYWTNIDPECLLWFWAEWKSTKVLGAWCSLMKKSFGQNYCVQVALLLLVIILKQLLASNCRKKDLDWSPTMPEAAFVQKIFWLWKLCWRLPCIALLSLFYLFVDI